MSIHFLLHGFNIICIIIFVLLMLFSRHTPSLAISHGLNFFTLQNMAWFFLIEWNSIFLQSLLRFSKVFHICHANLLFVYFGSYCKKNLGCILIEPLYSKTKVFQHQLVFRKIITFFFCPTCYLPDRSW